MSEPLTPEEVAAIATERSDLGWTRGRILRVLATIEAAWKERDEANTRIAALEAGLAQWRKACEDMLPAETRRSLEHELSEARGAAILANAQRDDADRALAACRSEAGGQITALTAERDEARKANQRIEDKCARVEAVLVAVQHERDAARAALKAASESAPQRPEAGR